MQLGALRALEFDRIVEAVRDCALTPMGDERLARLAPSTDPAMVAQLLAGTTETVRYLGANHALPLRASSELPQILASLGIEGREAALRLFSRTRLRKSLIPLYEALVQPDTAKHG